MVRSIGIFGQGGPPQGPPQLSPTYQQADKANREGFPAFSMTLEEQVLSVLMCNTLSNTFYASQKELAKETMYVLQEAADKDPEFLARACVYARERGLLKLAPVVGLAVLSAKDVGGRKDAFRRAFPRVVRIPDDLREFVVLCRKAQIRKGQRVKVVTKKQGDKHVVVDRQFNGNGVGGLGGVALAMTQHWLRHMSEYHTVKYGSARSEGITLRDILRMAHPKPKDEAMRERFGWLVKGWEGVGPEPSRTSPMIWALEKIKRTESVVEAVELIEKHRLPWEVVVPSVKKMTEAHWSALLKGMPYMALLRNLNTLERHGVLGVKETVKNVAKRLSDPENVKKSKQFPFRFLNAMKAFTGPQEIRDALSGALEASFVNMPEIKGRVCVSNDISGSMNSKISDKGEATYAEVAGIFGAAIFKKSEDVVLIPFDDVAHPELGRVSKMDSIMSIARAISETRGGTHIGSPMRHLLQQGEKVDVFIGITDNETWAADGFLTALEDYKARINPRLKAFLVTIAPYRDGVAPINYPDVYSTFGWSDAVLRYIPMVLASGSGQVDEVREIDLSAPLKAEKAVEESVTD